MIKLIIFDLDGVLVDTKNIHFDALNVALKEIDTKFVISFDDHIKEFDGLPTINKLNKLFKKKQLLKTKFATIQKRKNEITANLIKKMIKKDNRLIKIFKYFSTKYKIVVASNAIKKTVLDCLNNLEIKKYVNFIISNEDVDYVKPNPQIFLKSMVVYGISPKETLILEDSAKGRQAALNSGANLLPIEKLEDVNKENILNKINEINKSENMKTTEYWSSNQLNVLIPMAGAGKRFSEVGYTFPKPLIEVNGQPMIQSVVENLAIDAHYIFLVRKEHREAYRLDSMLPLIAKNCSIIEVEKLTEGAACTTLLAEEYINNDKQLIIANSDQLIEWNSIETMYAFTSQKIDGGILTFNSTHPRWSYAKLDNNQIVQEVAEKKPISNHATVGVYYWKKGSDYVNYAHQMIDKNIRTNNEFYVCPVYNEAIKDGKIIKAYNVKKMWGLGTPEDLQYFLNNQKDF